MKLWTVFLNDNGPTIANIAVNIGMNGAVNEAFPTVNVVLG